MKYLLKHIGPCLITQLQKFLKPSLRNNNRATEIFVAQTKNAFCRSAFQGYPFTLHPLIGGPVEGIYLGEILAVTPTPNREAVLIVIKIPEMKINQQLVRLQIH